MKIMLPIVFSLTLIFCVINLSGCTDESAKPEGNGRIKYVESVQIEGYVFIIVSVDGKEFITGSSGGFYPLDK